MNITSNENTELASNNIQLFSVSKEELAQFVVDLLQTSRENCPLTMTIKPDMLEGFCAITATIDVWDVLEKTPSRPFTLT